ncbi:MAG: T9SS type A sorting domain-containing protein [Candidatus Cloacimonetes bacterium]|nr:T9SS type A sorting domain-containing protein [Candidatus Cloacimonadota bacterium]
MFVRRFLVIIISFLFLKVWGESLLYEVDFELPLRIQEQGYTVLQYDQCQNMGKTGDPAVPWRGVQLLLPPGREALEVLITNIVYYPDSARMRIIPQQKPVPLSQYVNSEFTSESELYQQDIIYPEFSVSLPDTQYKNGHPIALLNISPVRYYPLRDSVVFIKSITIQLTLNSAVSAAEHYRHNESIAGVIAKIVDNPEKLSLFSETPERAEGIDILVITSAILSEAFGEFTAYKETCGFSTAIITTEEIYASYAGADEQEQIRNAIIDYYEHNELQYVILGGDSSPVVPERNIIPHRGFYGHVGGYEDYDIPSDMYYSCLDGTWNDDDDDIWGEYEEGDYFEEVCVGRISGATVEEISNHLHKLLYYQDSPVETDLEKCLLVGQQLGAIVFGGEYLEEIATGSDNWGYSTTGLSDNFVIIRLYEMYFGWETADLFYNLNNGQNFVVNTGHGNTDHCMKITAADLTPENICNDGIEQGYYNCYAQACYCGAFDNRTTILGEYLPESFAEKMTIMETGAASFIANSRYGWIASINSNGVSQHYMREFYDAVFGDGILRIGPANTASKEANASYLAESETHRWVYNNLNLLGDPTMCLWTQMPEDIFINIPDQLAVGESEIPFQTESSNLQYAVFMADELLACGNTGMISNQSMLLENPLTETGILDVYINQYNHRQFCKQIEVLPVNWELLLQNITLDDEEGWNPNGQADYGETISLSLALFNAGVQDISGIEIALLCTDEYVSLTDSIYVPEDLAAGETTEIGQAFRLTLAENIPDTYNIELIFQISIEGQVFRESYYDLTVMAPQLCRQEISVIDSNNGILDPGETVSLEIPIHNSGHSPALATSLNLFCEHPQITITDNYLDLGQIDPDAIATGCFEVSAAQGFPAGNSIEFILICQAGAYNFSDRISSYVGAEIEDFESGDFSQFDWTFPHTTEWLISDLAYEGDYSACTPPMGNTCATRLNLQYASQDGNLSFWIKTSVEQPNFCYFEFYLNGGDCLYALSGTHDWTYVEIPVPEGNNEYSWRYFTHIGGNSRLWLDYIYFPPKQQVNSEEILISKDMLLTNYPNPFNPETTISYILPEKAPVEISVYNIKGQRVRELSIAGGRRKTGDGRRSVVWDGKDETGNQVGSGIYLVRLRVEDKVMVRKVMMMK